MVFQYGIEVKITDCNMQFRRAKPLCRSPQLRGIKCDAADGLFTISPLFFLILLDKRNDLFDVRRGDFTFVEVTADSLFVEHDDVRRFTREAP
jgi:hypothetical protein